MVRKQAYQIPPSTLAGWKRHWHGLYATPRAWAHKGENLVDAFGVLAPVATTRTMDFDIHAQTLMIAGMAVEVLLKAILVHDPEVRRIVMSRSKSHSAKEKELYSIFYNHNLADIARAARVRLTRTQRLTALSLSQYIIWKGRYIVPTMSRITDLVPVPQENGLIGPSDRNVTISMAARLVERSMRAVRSRLYGEKYSRWRFTHP